MEHIYVIGLIRRLLGPPHKLRQISNCWVWAFPCGVSLLRCLGDTDGDNVYLLFGSTIYDVLAQDEQLAAIDRESGEMASLEQCQGRG